MATTTNKHKTYWNNKGRHQTEYDRLYEDLVPESGPADTRHGELLLAISRVYRDWYNNAGCNLELPRFQLHLFTINDWAQQIDDFNGRGNYLGTVEVMRPLIQWSRSVNRHPSNYQLDEAWERQLEMLVDAVIGVVFHEEMDGGAQSIDSSTSGWSEFEDKLIGKMGGGSARDVFELIREVSPRAAHLLLRRHRREA